MQVSQRIDCLSCVLGITLGSIGAVGDKNDVAISSHKILKIRQLIAVLVIIFERKYFYVSSCSRLSIFSFPSICPLSSLQEKQLLIEGSEIAVLYRALP